jgi:hypothetical protein
LRESANGYFYSKRINDYFTLGLLFTPMGDNLGNVGMLIGSPLVSQVMHSLSLFIDIPPTPADEAEVILAVNLIWLRWNHSPEQAAIYRDDYKLGTKFGAQRLLEDLDAVGQDFVASVSTPYAMAELLADLANYPCRVKWGGRPVSTDPYIYSSILFHQLGQNARAKEALDKGWREYNTPAPRAHWQNIRLQRFQTRRMILVRHFTENGGSGSGKRTRET